MGGVPGLRTTVVYQEASENTKWLSSAINKKEIKIERK